MISLFQVFYTHALRARDRIAAVHHEVRCVTGLFARFVSCILTTYSVEHHELKLRERMRKFSQRCSYFCQEGIEQLQVLCPPNLALMQIYVCDRLTRISKTNARRLTTSNLLIWGPLACELRRWPVSTSLDDDLLLTLFAICEPDPDLTLKQ